MRYLAINYLTKLDGRIDETIITKDKMSNDLISKYDIVIDFEKKKVAGDKFGKFQGKDGYENLLNYYRNIYPNLIEQLENDNG